jgi:hypothetical protein
LLNTHVSANSVDSDQYVDGSIDTVHIADGAVTSAKLDTNIAIAGTLGVTGDITGTLATAAQPNITSVGTLTGFTSTGIDDNADATTITIDSSENVGIGTASPVTFGENTHGITLNGTAAGQHLSFQQSDSYKGSLYNNDNTIILTSEIGEIQINAVSGVVFNQSGADGLPR